MPIKIYSYSLMVYWLRFGFKYVQNSLYFSKRSMLDLSRHSIASRQSSYVQADSVKSIIVKQFTFSDHSLAIRVRQKMMNLLTQFDANKDLTFDQQEISNALVALLMQSKTQIKYVLSNVFRYDVNNDGEVTYDQLTNFCVQQHFGEIAIQRLHRDELYSRGNQRIMNQEEFKKTIKYCLCFINIEPEESILSTLFKQIDIKNEKWVKYSIYFNFLKEYFGSRSYASDIVQIDSQGIVQFKFSDLSHLYNPHFKLLQNQLKPTRNIVKLGDDLTHSTHTNNFQPNLAHFTMPRTKSQKSLKKHLAYSLVFNESPAEYNYNSRKFGTQNNNRIYKSIFRPGAFSCLQNFENQEVYSKSLGQLQNKIVSLIYTQLKVIAMNYDKLHDLHLRKNSIQEMLKNQFMLNWEESQQFIAKVLNNQQNVGYECFIQQIMPYYFCQIYCSRNPSAKQFDIKNFAEHFNSMVRFLKVKPNKSDLEQLFQKNDFNKDGKMQMKDYKDMIGNLFRSYYFRKYKTMADVFH